MVKNFIKYGLLVILVISVISGVIFLWLHYEQEQKKLEIQEKRAIEQKLATEEQEKLSKPLLFEGDIAGYPGIITTINTRWLDGKIDYKAEITSNTGIFEDVYRQTTSKVPDDEWQFSNIDDLSITYSFYDKDGFKVSEITLSLLQFGDIINDNNKVVGRTIDGSIALSKEKYSLIDKMFVSHRMPIPKK